jgi:hypothetical protein
MEKVNSTSQFYTLKTQSYAWRCDLHLLYISIGIQIPSLSSNILFMALDLQAYLEAIFGPQKVVQSAGTTLNEAVITGSNLSSPSCVYM